METVKNTLIETVKKITVFCNDIPKNRKEISNMVDKLNQTEIPFALIPVDDPVGLYISLNSSAISFSGSIIARGRTEVNYYLNLLVEEKKLLIEEKKYNPTP